MSGKPAARACDPGRYCVSSSGALFDGLPVFRGVPGEASPPGPEQDGKVQDGEGREERLRQVISLRVGFFFDGGDCAASIVRGERCRASRLGYGEQEERALLDYCLPRQAEPMTSHGRQRSNIARLYDLYRDESCVSLARDAATACISVYAGRVGTALDTVDGAFPGMARGTAESDVLETIERSTRELLAKLAMARAGNPGLVVGKLELDLFGFSRGAAAARHFVNDLRRGSASLLAQAMCNGLAPLAEGFGWRFGEDVQVNLLGLFDTVLAIGERRVGDGGNTGLKLYLAPDSAKQVIHLVAGDEYRHEYALDSCQPGFVEIALPGSHGDIGGNYPLEAEEKLFLTRPFHEELEHCLPNEESQAWRQASRALVTWRERGLIDPARSNGKLYIDWRQARSSHSPMQHKKVYAQVKLERRVRGEYGRIPLRIMHTLAQEAGVPFNRLAAFEPEMAIPRPLQRIADKLMAYAQGKACLNLEFEEMDLLYAHFLHQTAHWNVYPGEDGEPSAHFVNRPGKNDQRTIHPNTPDPLD